MRLHRLHRLRHSRSTLDGGACDGLSGKGAFGQAAALRWSGRRCAPTALRCTVSWPRRRTHCALFVRSVQTTATSQLTARAAREATSPALLGAPEARRNLPERAFAATPLLSPRKAALVASRQGGLGGGAVCGDEEVSPDSNRPEDCLCLANGRASWPGAACKARVEVGARSALRQLTCCRCLNAANEVSAVSSAARPRTEHRSAVGAKRRPPQPAPPPGAPCCDARTPANGN